MVTPAHIIGAVSTAVIADGIGVTCRASTTAYSANPPGRLNPLLPEFGQNTEYPAGSESGLCSSTHSKQDPHGLKARPGTPILSPTLKFEMEVSDDGIETIVPANS